MVEQQFHHTAKMTSNKYFPKVMHANYHAKLKKTFSSAVGSKACFARKMFAVAKVFINLAPTLTFETMGEGFDLHLKGIF